jgi:hypothetical protein
MRAVVLVIVCILAAAAAPATAQAPTAIAAVEWFREAALPIGDVFVYTESKGTLLGRPGQFVEKIVWHDTRLEARRDTDGDLTLDAGGSIERFSSAADMAARIRYVETFDGTILSTNDYRYTSGLMFLRITFALTPSQAEEYRLAFDPNAVPVPRN